MTGKVSPEATEEENGSIDLFEQAVARAEKLSKEARAAAQATTRTSQEAIKKAEITSKEAKEVAEASAKAAQEALAIAEKLGKEAKEAAQASTRTSQEVLQKAEKIHRVNQPDVFWLKVKLRNSFPGAGMDGINHREGELITQLAQTFHDGGEPLLIVHILLTMQGDEEVFLWFKVQVFQGIGFLTSQLQVLIDRINNSIARYEDSFFWHPLIAEYFLGFGRGREEIITEVVSENPIYLLGHAAVVGTQACLHMSHLNMKFSRG